MGTARSFLLLFIFVVVLFGIPIFLLVLRLIETISERRREVERRSEKQAELTRRSEDKSTDDPDSSRRIISTSDMKNA